MNIERVRFLLSGHWTFFNSKFGASLGLAERTTSPRKTTFRKIPIDSELFEQLLRDDIIEKEDTLGSGVSTFRLTELNS